MKKILGGEPIIKGTRTPVRSIIGTVAEFAAEPIWCVRNGHNWRDISYIGLSLYASRDGAE